MTKMERAIVNLIREKGTMTKPQISELISVSLTTVNKYVNELVEEGILAEEGSKTRVRTEGKPPLYYKINSEYQSLLGIYLKRKEIRMLVTDNLCSVQIKEVFKISNCEKFNEKDLCNEIINLFKKYKLKGKIKKVSLGIPGVLEEKNDIISEIPSFPQFEKKNLSTFLEKKLKLPVIIENDVNLSLKTLHNMEKYRNYKDLVYFFIISSNVGGGAILDGKLYKGFSNLCGEFAYLGVDREYFEKHKMINSENVEKYFIEKFESKKYEDFLFYTILRIIVTFNPEIIFFESDYLNDKDLGKLRTKLKKVFDKTHLPKLEIIINNDLGETGTIINALDEFYHEKNE